MTAIPSYRVLLVGAGIIGRRHAENLMRLVPGVRLSVLRGQLGPDWPGAVDYVADYETALAAKPDAAVVASPTAAHLEALVSLLPAGVPCYVEKPVVSNRAQFHELQTILAGLRAPPVTFAGCNFRLMPSLQRLKTLLDTGAIGRVVRASIQVGQWLPDWRPGRDYRSFYSADAERGGGVILDLIHEIDQVRWLLGEFEQVQAVAGHLSQLQIDSEDTACALLSRPGGPFVTLAQDYVARRRVRRYEFVGDAGTLTWDFAEAKLTLTNGERSETVDCGPAAFDVAATYAAALEAFLAGVARGTPTSQDLRDGLASLDLALRIKEAAGL